MYPKTLLVFVETNYSYLRPAINLYFIDKFCAEAWNTEKSEKALVGGFRERLLGRVSYLFSPNHAGNLLWPTRDYLRWIQKLLFFIWIDIFLFKEWEERSSMRDRALKGARWKLPPLDKLSKQVYFKLLKWVGSLWCEISKDFFARGK